MHYYIDGYNLLFALFGPSMPDFTSRRDWLIQTLNAKAELLALEISLVFDSHFCEGLGSRSHFHHLEILYTPKGVSADDYIIKKIEKSTDPRKALLVSNDRELTLRARNLLANTQSLNEFTNWLDRRYKNKTQKKSNPVSSFKLPTLSEKTQIKVTTVPPPALTSKPEKPRLKLKLISVITPETKQPAKVLVHLAEDLVTPEKPRVKLKLISEQKVPPEARQPAEVPLSPAEVPGTLEYYLAHFESADELFLVKLEEKKIKRKERKKRDH
ncbi:MAG: NYN domain-containing protein [Parachlamydiaceae bacterium]|nr:NYN domain-containing protein [Parachlamydiaceae bacterium]